MRALVNDGSGASGAVPPPKLNAGCGLTKETFAGLSRNEEDAPCQSGGRQVLATIRGTRRLKPSPWSVAIFGILT